MTVRCSCTIPENWGLLPCHHCNALHLVCGLLFQEHGHQLPLPGPPAGIPDCCDYTVQEMDLTATQHTAFQPHCYSGAFQENSFVTKDCCIPGNRHQLPKTMNSVFCKCVLGTHVVWIRTFPGTGTLKSMKIISVPSCSSIGLVEIGGGGGGGGGGN